MRDILRVRVRKRVNKKKKQKNRTKKMEKKQREKVKKEKKRNQSSNVREEKEWTMVLRVEKVRNKILGARLLSNAFNALDSLRS